ncbi:ABC transporter ATP-binding protein [Poseidonibacter ostreae]|jgi:putative hydroxymethylpyrimidine transport system ATP-binding protein|uniref:ATP-binding cassette domain-containing protein n=1 Tax=Poseidonibacter ostreae TaxID=2654171 RepID=A0A6L4WWY4_9BACT|nr:ABC transporter ATP-binding protein [Poseidonibacter ostreae]KAB7887645.1 ATP-binding cassette domain-containing protein [Poseidonibacter ostreae]KAB7890666.1 ATP-binding cassette domain-containing protein [Poseidonibacter ostreae]KAB7892351.1 ATP-binding cassette domain-containing protein [Poseidonibacter ostreae]
MDNNFIAQIQNLNLDFKGKKLFKNLNFNILENKSTALLGSSGVGKSTLLRCIADLEKENITNGEIVLKKGVSIAWLSQENSLYPWLSILDNVQLYHHLKGSKSAQTLQKAKELLSQVNMSEHVDKKTYELSGGQKQRVALARTLMQDANFILMDEPFSALDAITKIQLQDLTCHLLKDKTILLVTHDPQEAIKLANHIYILKNQPVILEEVASLQGDLPHKLSNEKLWNLQDELISKLQDKESQV